MLRALFALVTASLLSLALAPDVGADVGPSLGRGCCSHHGGVSGSCCPNGNDLCNDGVCSPTCRC
jgi:hypothetical protein